MMNNCLTCGKELKRRDGKYCSYSCYWAKGSPNKKGEYLSSEISAKVNQGIAKKGKPSGSAGKHWKLSDYTKERQSIGMSKSFEDRDAWNKGLTNSSDNRVAEANKKSARTRTGKKKPEMMGDNNPSRRAEVKVKKNNTLLKSIEEGTATISHAKIRGYFDSIKNQKQIPYRSSYELKRFNMLELDDSVLRYEYEKVRVRYTDANKNRITIVDLLVYCKDGTKRLEEVKAAWKLDDEETKLKLAAIENYAKLNNLSFLLVTEKELGIN